MSSASISLRTGSVENGADGEAATWTGRPKAERTGRERITSFDVRSGSNLRFGPARNDSAKAAQWLFATLTVYHDRVPHSAATNMAIDEALLEYATDPLIRFYRWQSPALSFGYFGRFADVASYQRDRDLVRRWTGGGIVFHGEDLTYSIVIPANGTAFAESSMSIYEKIHTALVDAFSEKGQRAELLAVVAAVHDRQKSGKGDLKTTSAAANRRSFESAVIDLRYGDCFANPVRADVMIGGKKVAGAAQRRTRSGLLQQGSVQSVDLENGLAQRFARALSTDCGERKLDDKILNRARELAELRYGTDAWLRKR